MGKFVDITGEKFHRLTALCFVERKRKLTYWKFKCDCGNETITTLKGVREGTTKSCGCLQKETARNIGYNNRKHSFTNQELYPIILQINERCCNPKSAHYPEYGGRGIGVCDRWNRAKNANWVANFEDDMGTTWQEGLTLDRIDNNLGYCLDNCRWANKSTQQRNQRKRKGGSSKYKGVYWLKSEGLWVANITINYKKHYLGRFKNEVDAAKAYDNSHEQLPNFEGVRWNKENIGY